MASEEMGDIYPIFADTREFAVSACNQRSWEPPVKRYIDHREAYA